MWYTIREETNKGENTLPLSDILSKQEVIDGEINFRFTESNMVFTFDGSFIYCHDADDPSHDIFDANNYGNSFLDESLVQRIFKEYEYGGEEKLKLFANCNKEIRFADFFLNSDILASDCI